MEGSVNALGDSLPLTQRMMTLSAWLSISAGLAWNVKGQPQPLLKGQETRLFFDPSSLVDQRLNSSLKLFIHFIQLQDLPTTFEKASRCWNHFGT